MLTSSFNAYSRWNPEAAIKNHTEKTMPGVARQRPKVTRLAVHVTNFVEGLIKRTRFISPTYHNENKKNITKHAINHITYLLLCAWIFFHTIYWLSFM